MTLYDELKSILSALDQANVDYALVGALAVAVWGVPLMTLDFMIVDKNLEPAWASRTRLPFADRDVSVISRDALIAMKARAARPQDIADIQSLKDIDR